MEKYETVTFCDNCKYLSMLDNIFGAGAVETEPEPHLYTAWPSNTAYDH
jgi:hypothetical protein